MLKMLNPLGRLCLLSLLSVLSLTGCAPPTKPAANASLTDAGSKAACRGWRPVTWAPDDTTVTIDGVRRNNKRRWRYCGGALK